MVTAAFLIGGGVYAGDIEQGNKLYTEQTGKKSFLEHEAIVMLSEDSSLSDILGKMQKVLGTFTHHEYSLIRAMYIKVPGKSFDEIKTLLGQFPFVKSVEKNYRFQSLGTNDSYYSKLWAIENEGQEVNGKQGTVDADMDVDKAWDIEKGQHDVVVAVLDTGVDYTHEDLADNMWSGNAHHGYDFAGDDDGNNDDDPMPDTPYDQNGHYHGTHVAGTIGAVGGNDLGVVGVVQNVQIMAVKVFRPKGYAYTNDILEGLDYVAKQVDNGVNIVAINASYGGGGGQNGDATDKAIKKLGEKGVVFCAAAGNDSSNIDYNPTYPASYDAPNIITVAASDQDDKLASFSNYGKKTVEVAAPGTNILSTYPQNKYEFLQGTSMATPQVTGAVALLASAAPESSVNQRIKAIENNVDVKNSLKDKTSSGGRVNIYKAVKALTGDNGENTPPTANDDTATTDYETAVVVDVLANDSDDDGDALSIVSVTQPVHGSAVVENGKIKYTPDENFSGDDTFSYTIDDGHGGQDSADVSVHVKEKSSGGGFFGGFFGDLFGGIF